ncbi:MAG: hypothetical protein KOO63_15710 [Bacteroidales bacterium]|nr:hypothetical protein [Candidatus Latescibacterota bacterium]
MKKLVLLAVALMLIPGALFSAEIIRDGDPAFFVGFSPTAQVIKGETWCEDIANTNFGFVSTLCPLEDTFCIHYYDLLGWAIAADFPEGECFIVGSGSYYWNQACITVPCDAVVGSFNTFCAYMAFCDVEEVCQPDSADCENPNVYSGGDYWSTTCVELEVVESPPALYILQDTLYYVEQGAVAAYIPFSICNGDPCAPATIYGYNIVSKGLVGGAIDVLDVTAGIVGGYCEEVYGIIDAGISDVCDYDTLTIIAWDDATGTVYDTCVQVIHVVEPVPVPLFTTPVVTILVLAMILAAAVIMKRTAISKA